MADTEPPPGLPFPTDPQEFDADDRISFSKLDNKFVGVLDDGSEFEWDNELKRWIPTIDEELLAQQQSAYGVGAADEAAQQAQPNNNNKKRRNGGAGERPAKRQNQRQGGGGGQPRQNTAIYVTGLPPDATAEEVHEVFSRKCGVVAEEIDSGRPRIKMYTDAETGAFKGDALVVFFKPQSVDMAIMLLDDAEFRYTGRPDAPRMRVQAADASYKKTNYEEQQQQKQKHKAAEGADDGVDHGAEGKKENGDAAEPQQAHNPITGEGAPRAPRDRAREQDKAKIIKRTQKLDARLADWDDDDEPYGPPLETAAPRARTVVLRHMFTLPELDADPAALLEIKEDIRDECAKLGAVTSVVLYDAEPAGVASVKFADPAAARACAARLDGRAFDGRTVRAHLADGKLRFRRSDRAQGDVEVDVDE
ncbi:hypothetical protein F4780DRAFT_734624 [Xylariomycetidae sp. FL0641]|nr:hypothetical protein F4780DRAFT_734624 [Xylariomycetidae sp. FL0641]